MSHTSNHSQTKNIQLSVHSLQIENFIRLKIQNINLSFLFILQPVV